jgi:protein-tyrosine-phosphatase/predicted ATP-grasp superfamily ATP-dependent carboligase
MKDSTRSPVVLVLDGHSSAAVESVQSLGRARMVVDVAAEAPGVLAFRSGYARQRLAQPSALDAAGFRAWLARLDAASSYDLVVVSTETSLLAFRELEEHDPLRVKAVLPSNRALDVALDKHRTWEHACSLGVRVPETALITRLDDVPSARGYPVVLKPVRSKVRAATVTALEPRIVATDEERGHALREWLPVVAVQQQQYVSGTGVGVELLYDRGRAVLSFVHERIHEWPLTGGASTYRRSLPAAGPMVEAALRLLDALAWHGVAMVEFKRQLDGTWYLMEINPRLWGSLALAIDAGVDFPRALAAIACGGPAPAGARYRRYHTRYLPGDLKWMWSNLRADPANPLLMTRPPVRAALEYLRPLAGRESWDYFDWHDLGVTRAMLARLVGRAARGGWSVLRRRRRRLALPRHHRDCLARLRHPVRHVLLVCHGNICRSAFAEGYARQVLATLSTPSVGFHPIPGRVSPPAVRAAAARLGVDLGAHRSTPITRAHVDEADLIVVMDVRNYESLLARFPDAAVRTTMLGLFARRPRAEIPDPVLAGEAAAREILAFVAEAVDGLGRWLCAQDRTGPRVEPSLARSRQR